MTIKLNKNQFDYLNNSLLLQKKFELKQIKQVKHSFYIEIDENTADEIRDWASDELQKKGFDANYDLNSDGKLLEELIDAFYIE